MRVWDVDVGLLCDRHLLGEHRELHAIWTILSEARKGYSRHPETLRWVGHLPALFARHEAQVAEMARRGFQHASPLDAALATGSAEPPPMLETVADQIARLQQRDCDCFGRP